MTWRFDYRRWDGSQDSLIDDTDSVLAQLTDDLLANGDLHEALQRILNRGWETPDGQRIQGLRELLDELRLEREEQLDRGDLGGAYREIAEELQRVLAEERTGIEQLQADAQASGDQRRQEVTDEVAAERRMQLDLLPSDLAGTVRGLQNYEFVSSEARQHFEELMEQLREEVAKTYFDQMSEALSNPDPEQLAHMREGFDALNRMIEQREAGEPIDPSFESFMERFGDMFPGNPKDLDELLEQLAAQMAAAQAMWNSMTPEQQEPAPGSGRIPPRGPRPPLAGGPAGRQPPAGLPRGRLGPALPLQRRPAHGHGGGDRRGRAGCGDLDELENFLRSANSPAALSEVDLDKVRRHLGDDAANSLDRLAKLTKQLQDAGLIDQREGRFELTPQGIRRIGQQALADLFGQLTKDRVGNHRTTWTGIGHDREETTKPYEFGDPFNLDLSRTVHNAVRRAGSGVPVRLSPDDFEVIETEALTRSATVLLLDLSLSMPMRDNFVPAKKMAMALHTLISTRFPRDYLGLVGFSEVARDIEPEDLPTVSWDYVYGTNLQHGLILARKMLAHQQGTKQIILVTDGEPTAHVIPYEGGVGYDVYFNYPPVPRDPARSRWPRSAVHPGQHHHQHLPARPRPGAPGLRRAAGPDQPRPHLRHHARTSWATTCWSTSWPTRPRSAPGDAGPAERRRRVRRRRAPVAPTTPQGPRSATLGAGGPSVSSHVSAGFRPACTGPRRNQNSCSQERITLAFPAAIVKDDISVVTSVLCGSVWNRVDDWEGDLSMDMVSLMYGPQERSWQTKANCMGVDPDLFFPERGASTREAKEVCRGCVVREDCLEYALANGEKFGIWGGLSERERRRLRRQRAMQRRATASAS